MFSKSFAGADLADREDGGSFLITALRVRGPEKAILPLDVHLMASSLEMKNPEGSVMFGLPLGLRIVPSSCRGVQCVAGDGLHLRLQVQAYSSTKLVPTLKESLKVGKNCVFYCQACGAVVMEERTFLRILPLPSENWNSLVEEWCCHADPFANKILQPRDNDCFLGDTYILVKAERDPCAQEMTVEQQDNSSSTSESVFALKTEGHTRVICKRCKAVLGERPSSDTVKYYITEIVIQQSCRDINLLPRSCFVESVAAQHLAEFSTARSTFRFSIQGHDGKTYLLLWLLNSDMLLVEAGAHMASGNIFTVLEDSFRPDAGTLELRNAIKVLYHPCIKDRNKELVSAWANDPGVHSLMFPSHTCLELLLLLCSSNRSLPASLRRMDSFQVAFLKM